MNVGARWFSPFQAETQLCGGHGDSAVVQRVNSQSGFFQEEAGRTIGRQNETLSTSANLGPSFSRRVVRIEQQQDRRFSAINSDPFLSAVKSEASGLLLPTKGSSNLRPLTTERPARNERIGYQTQAGRPCLSSACLSSISRERWMEKRSNAGGITFMGRKLKGLRNRPIHRSIARLRAVVPGGEDRVAMEEVDLTIRTRGGGGGGGGSFYRPFVNFAVQELSRRQDFSPLLLKEEFRNMTAHDVTANIDNMAFSSSKIRLFRIVSIQTGSSMQILNVAGFARAEYDLPIFCADFFSVPNKNIIVLDLNPLHNTDKDKDYMERYFNDLIPLANKYTEVLPWGDKLTAESLQFFSPLVLWTKAEKGDLSKFLYPAFQDYLGAWLKMVDSVCPATDAVALARNQEAQHRYISWRVTKDPGRPLLRKLYGEQLSERYIKEFLFNGISTLGTKSFLDYFPEYRNADGSINKHRSMIGKSFEKRPWDKVGSFSPE